MKERYEELKMEVIEFEAEDVIQTSCTATALVAEEGDVIN